MAPYALRKAVQADAETIKSLVTTVLSEYGLRFDGEKTDSDLHALSDHYENNGGGFYVMEDSGGIIATGAIYRLDNQRCELRKMYILHNYRGQGLGKKLLAYLLNEAKHLGFNRVELETASVLKEAIGLYQSFGFQPCQLTHLSSRCDQGMYLLL